jgi:hypothetical protein
LFIDPAYARGTAQADEAGQVARKPIPRPGYLDTCDYLGYIHGERQWRTPDGRYLLTWDGLHGEIEAYDRLGRHRGVLDALTGEWTDGAVPGRRIDV